MFYFLEDLISDIRHELKYNEVAQVVAVVVAVVSLAALFVAFISAVDPTPVSYMNVPGLQN